ncbi:MAG: serine/threonine protein kinase [Acidobacteria bacterium]|nr:serine/threonine protein kinase [Acidobacteriota bacterium]
MSLPKQFGRYQVLDVLGQGAMGLVYRAVDPVIERDVAIKVIQADPGLGEAELERMQARFQQEFRSAGALSHSNIVTIFDVGKEGDLYYIAMEYVEGLSLDTVLGQKGVLSFKEVSDLACELASGLDYAHGQGVLHRDIKPANVLITSAGRFKITDFGLAKLEATTLTRTGADRTGPASFPVRLGGCNQVFGSRYRSRWHDHRRETRAITARVSGLE